MRFKSGFLHVLAIIFIFQSGFLHTALTALAVQATNTGLDWAADRLTQIIKRTVYPAYFNTDNISILVDTSGTFLPPQASKAQGYRVKIQRNRIQIYGYDLSGAFYGCLYLADMVEKQKRVPLSLDHSDAPRMLMRGTGIYLMKDGDLHYPITPDHFPFFYDKSLWSDYLDFMVAQRFNVLTLWNENPFDYFVRLDEYPQIEKKMGSGLLQKNQSMLRWLIAQAKKRNIQIYLAFFNIHPSVYFQELTGVPFILTTPTAEIERYIGHSIESFIKKFPDIGLFINQSNNLKPEHKTDWIKRIIFNSIEQTGKNPPLIINGNRFDLAYARSIRDLYHPLSFARPYSGQAIRGVNTDRKNRGWAKLNSRLIIHIPKALNLSPFRWAPHRYIQKCVQDMEKIGANGLHLAARKPWRWPYTGDADSTIFEWYRDDLWYESWARYAWNPDLDQKREEDYWLVRYMEKFGSERFSANLLRAYAIVADVMPGLERLLGSAGQTGILLSAGMTLEQLENAVGSPRLNKSETLRIPAYLHTLRENLAIRGSTPIYFLSQKSHDAESAYQTINQAISSVSRNRSTAYKYLYDFEAMALLTRFYLTKMQAVRSKTLAEVAINPQQYYSEFLADLQQSVHIFAELTKLVEKTYTSLADSKQGIGLKRLRIPFHWKDILPIYQEEFIDWQQRTEEENDPFFNRPELRGLAGILIKAQDIRTAVPYPTDSLSFDWSTSLDNLGMNWTAEWHGYLVPPESGMIRLLAESDQGVKISIDNQVVLEWSGLETKRSAMLKVAQNEPRRIDIYYQHDGGKKAYLNIRWQWKDQSVTSVPASSLRHSRVQAKMIERKMERD